METLSSIADWLFNDRMGVMVLMFGGVLVFLIIAFVLEKPLRKEFYNHEKGPDDWDLFDSDDE